MSIFANFPSAREQVCDRWGLRKLRDLTKVIHSLSAMGAGLPASVSLTEEMGCPCGPSIRIKTRKRKRERSETKERINENNM